MFIQNAVLKSISAEGLAFPLSEGSVVSVGGVTGIVPTTLNVRPATNRIYVAVAGTIDLTSDANKGVTFTNEQIQELGADFNFVPAVESGGGGGGGAFIINISVDVGGMRADKTFAEIMAAYRAGSIPVGVIMGSYMMAERIVDDPDNGVVQFSLTYVEPSGVSQETLYINSDDTVTSATASYP